MRFTPSQGRLLFDRSAALPGTKQTCCIQEPAANSLRVLRHGMSYIRPGYSSTREYYPLNTKWLETSIEMIDAFGSYGGLRWLGVGLCLEYKAGPGPCEEDNTPIEPHSLYGNCKASAARLSLLPPGSMDFLRYGRACSCRAATATIPAD